MSATLDFENNCPQVAAIPAEPEFLRWIESVLAHLPNRDNAKAIRLGVRIVDEEESAQLNNTYRHKNYATNVLSFGCELPKAVLASLDELPLGDLAICAQVVEREALEQEKPSQAHWAHMLVHGVLHLHGFDHIDEAEAEEMESIERQILASLGFPDPYLVEHATA